MIINKTIWIFILLYSSFILGQETEVIQEPIEIISTRSMYLNSGVGSQINGASRAFIKVDLPSNTVKWYYSFTTSMNKNSFSPLNLMSQLATLCKNNELEKKEVSAIEVPTGICGIDIYLLTKDNVDPFLNKVDLRRGNYAYSLEGTVQNTKQAVVEVDDITSKTIYLGLKNPGRFLGANIMIEVVAITETIIEEKKSSKKLKAELFGYSARDEYDTNNYVSCISYCNKSNQLSKIGWVKGLKGLAELKLLRKEKALQTFFDAILLINEQSNKIEVFSNLLSDLKKIEQDQPTLQEVSKIIKMIEIQIE